MRLDEARARRRGRARRPSCELVAEALERLEHAARAVGRARPGPGRSTRRSTRSPTAPASTRIAASGGVWRRAFDDQVGDGPLEQGGVGEDRRQRLGDVDLDAVGRLARGSTARRRRPRPSRRRHGAAPDGAGLEAAHVEEVADEGVEPVGLLVDRLEELVGGVGRPVDVVLEQAGHRRLDRRQRRPQVVRHGPRAARCAGRRPRPATTAAAASARSRRCSSAERELGGEGVEDPLVLGRERPDRRGRARRRRRRVGDRLRRPSSGVGRVRRRPAGDPSSQSPASSGSRDGRRASSPNVDAQPVEQRGQRVVLADQAGRRRGPAPRPRPQPGGSASVRGPPGHQER